jgi:uncharacterized membrane protein
VRVTETALVASPAAAPASGAHARALAARYWPLALLTLAAAAIRLATLDQQSLWYDEAVTAVRVLRPSLGATLEAVVHIENTPPLYYVLAWGWTRVFGTGVFALRSLSALAGVACVPVAWAIGAELGTRRTAIVLAAIVATNPLFIWYSQEARSYELFLLLAAAAFLFFLRARRTARRPDLGCWALCSALALLAHYFALFLIVPEAAVLLRGRWRDVRVIAAVGFVVACALALAPLAAAQGGRGTGWIGNWPLTGRLEAVAGYYLLGESGRPLGRAALLLAALPLVLALALVPLASPQRRRRIALTAGIGGFAVAVPLALALLGSDYFAPRYLIAAYVPLSAAFALLASAPGSPAGALLTGLVCASNLIVIAAVDTRPQLQRGDWSGVAAALHGGPPERAVVVAVIGALPLEYYDPGLHQLAPWSTARVREIDLVGYAPLRGGATHPPVRGFRLVRRTTRAGIVVLRFRAPGVVLVHTRRLLARRPVSVDSTVLAAGPAP